MSFLPFFFLLFFEREFQCYPGWSGTLHVVEGELELLECYDYRCATTPHLWSAGMEPRPLCMLSNPLSNGPAQDLFPTTLGGLFPIDQEGKSPV